MMRKGNTLFMNLLKNQQYQQIFRNIFYQADSKKIKPKAPEIHQVKKQWNDFADGYNKFDMGPQTFYYSFISLMNLKNAKNILEVACGSGKLLPLAIMLKNQNTKYNAVDLSQNMIEKSKFNLKQNLLKYSDKISLDDWCKSNNLILKVANAQQKISQQKFDRIICNCVLMLTQNPQKMLQNLYNQASQGCLLGISVWGDKQKNNFMTSMRDSILQSGFQLPKQRSNFHLYGKVRGMAQSIGWKTKLKWQQNALFPLIEFDMKNYEQLFVHQINKLPQNQRAAVKNKMIQKVSKIFENKEGLNFNCQLYIFEK